MNVEIRKIQHKKNTKRKLYHEKDDGREFESGLCRRERETVIKRERVVLVLGIVLIAGAVLSAQEEQKERYPFFPSLLNTSTGQPIESSKFIHPTMCQGCHGEIFDQWKGSMHSHAFHDPVFQALWILAAEEAGGKTDKLCAGCHTAIGTVSEEVVFSEGTFQASEIAQQGVQCDLCHSVTASTFLETPTHLPQNASIIVDPGIVKRGPYRDSVSPFHECAYSDLHTRSEFCGNCHNVFHPVTNFHIENTYSEWKFSVYAQKGIQCQDCHMMPVEAVVEAARTLEKPVRPGKASIMGPERDQVYTHDFVGGNFTVTSLLGSDRHANIARKRLQSAAELYILAPDPVGRGEMVTIKVKVTNVGAGHHLPTSLTEVRQMWLDVSVTDDSGLEVYRSGGLDSEGNIDPEAVIFNAQAVTEEGEHTVKPWEIARFEYNHTIPPKGSATEKYTFLIPSDAEGPMTVSITLRYRSYPQSVANMLLGEDAPVLPVVDMAREKVQLSLE